MTAPDYSPLLSGTSRADGYVMYDRGSPPNAPIPNSAGGWAFPAYDYLGSGHDFGGTDALNCLDMFVDGPGRAVVGTAAFDASVATFDWWLYHYDPATLLTTVEQSGTGLSPGTTVVVDVPDDGHAQHLVRLGNFARTTVGTKVGFTGGVFPAPPTVDFSGTPLSGPANLSVDFTDLSTGAPPVAWDWDFGDGSPHSTAQNPTHVYTVPGTYTVSLTATALGGADATTVKAAYVTVGTPRPVGVWFDWTEGGFGAGANDDCTADVESWTITRGSGPEVLDGANPGAMTLVLNSPADDRYNPRNALGPLYGKLIDGVRVWVGVDSAEGALSGTDPRGLFAGRITDITPLPMAGADAVPQVEIVCEDALGWLKRRPVEIAAARDRSQAELRALVLSQAGETRTVVPTEPVRLALSSWRGSARDALEAINQATGTRHFARPSDDRDLWYDYVARDRMWGLDGVPDFSLDDSGAITGTSGWRLSADTVVNRQEASVEPVAFTAGDVTVWEHPSLPFTMTAESRELVVDFDDFVDGPVVDLNYSGAAPSTLAIEALGDAARITIATAGTMTVTRLAVIGRLARRGLAETVREDDAASQAGSRGIRAGGQLSGDLLGPTAAARGLCRHVVWRHGSPQYRPQAVVEAWHPGQFEVDLYDVVEPTVAQLGGPALFEVVGLQHDFRPAATPVLTLTLQESRVQAPTSWFKVGSSLLGGPDVLAP